MKESTLSVQSDIWIRHAWGTHCLHQGECTCHVIIFFRPQLRACLPVFSSLFIYFLLLILIERGLVFYFQVLNAACSIRDLPCVYFGWLCSQQWMTLGSPPGWLSIRWTSLPLTPFLGVSSPCCGLARLPHSFWFTSILVCSVVFIVVYETVLSYCLS